MISLLPYHKVTNNCLQDVLYMVLLWRRADPIYLYKSSWNFGYNRSKEKFNERVLTNRHGHWIDNDLFSVLDETYGIQTHVYMKLSNSERLELVDSELEKERPSVILVDSGRCPWHMCFHKYSSPHYIPIVGKTSEGYLCVIYTRSDQEYFYETIPSHLVESYLLDDTEHGYVCFTFEFNEMNEMNERSISCQDISKMAEKTLKGVNGESDYIQMRRYAEDLSNITDINAHLNHYDDIWAEPLIRNVERVAWSRMQVYEVMECCKLLPISFLNRMGEIKASWLRLKNQLMKLAVVKSSEVKGTILATMINQIADQEQEFANELVSLYETDI